MKTIVCFFVLMVGICLISGCNSPISQKPNLVIKDFKITKQITQMPTCEIKVNGYVKNEGNKEAVGYYVLCDYYNGGERLAHDGTIPISILEKTLYVGAEESFSFSQWFRDPDICNTIKVECKGYSKES